MGHTDMCTKQPECYLGVVMDLPGDMLFFKRIGGLTDRCGAWGV